MFPYTLPTYKKSPNDLAFLSVWICPTWNKSKAPSIYIILSLSLGVRLLENWAILHVVGRKLEIPRDDVDDVEESMPLYNQSSAHKEESIPLYNKESFELEDQDDNLTKPTPDKLRANDVQSSYYTT